MILILKSLVLGLFLGLLFNLNLNAHTNGFKYFKNYSLDEPDFQPQNWAIVQDKQGIIFAANQGGLAEYDGISWRKIAIPNYTVRSLAVDDKGTVYVGGNNEIGFLEATSQRSLQYVSLVNHLEANQRDFGSVWKTHSLDGMVYSRSSNFLFRWNPNSHQMKVWEADNETKFASSFVCAGKLFIFRRRIGLMHMVNHSLVIVPGGEALAKTWITMMAPYDQQRILIGTIQDGFFLYDGSTLVSFPTGADQYIKKNQLYHGIGLSMSPGDFALGTLQGGAAIIDAQGTLKYIFNKDSGLKDNDVKYLFEDSSGNIWAALNNGITRIEYASPFSIYDSRDDLPGLVLSVVRHGPQNLLLAGTTSGLYVLYPDGKFRLFKEITSICWSLLSLDNSLLVGATSGLFLVEDNTKNQIIDLTCFFLYRSPGDHNRTWVGTDQGLVSLYRGPDSKKNPAYPRWEIESTPGNIHEEIRSIVEDQKGNLWLGTPANGVLKVEFTGKGQQAAVTRYDVDTHGLPKGEITVFMAANHVMIGTNSGLYRFDEETNGFLPDRTLGDLFSNGTRGVFRLARDRDENIWFHSDLSNFQALHQPDGTYRLNAAPFLRVTPGQVNSIYFDPDGYNTWFAGHKNLLRFDTRVKKDYSQPFRVFIRRVMINEKPLRSEQFRGINYPERNVRFTYAAPFFEAEEQTRYRCRLAGYDGGWSQWSDETRKDYTNLDPGLYTFNVEAKNVYGTISRGDSFRFRVLPPWYRTWWAYLVYAFVFFPGMYQVVKWRSHKLEKERQRLEQVVLERTKEINSKNRQLENQTLQLKDQSVKLKEMDEVKSRFFANISHEFRTPLTLIMGPLEQRLSRCRDREQEEELNMMLRNSQRLLTLINQLLDLSKLDSGKMRLRAAARNVVPFLKGIFASFDSLAMQKKLELKLQVREENIILYFDREKMEKIIGNLLANAFKFTPAGGQIILSVKRISQARSGEDSQCGADDFVEISIRDTGIGIPRDRLGYIFDRFYQVESSRGHLHEGTGTGIGLALVKELVDLHHGEIEVQSVLGQGTEFILKLPLGPDQPEPGEITGEIDETPIPVHYNNPEMIEKVPVGGEIEAKTGEVQTITGQDEDMEKDVILVVEDSADVRRYIRSTLESLYTLVEAADGQEGIDKARAIIPDLIISDVMMPGTDGFQLCTVLKKDVKTSHIPIVLLTARASEESIVEGLETGADDYITKPFNTKILLTRIKNLIDLRRQLQEKIQRDMMLHPVEIRVSSIDRQFMKELKEAIEANLSDPDFCVDELAGALVMSRTSLNRKIKALTGESTNQFIQSYRLKRGAQLLKTNFGNVTEVAFKVGFSSSPYFTKCFKEKFHQLPHTLQAQEPGSN